MSGEVGRTQHLSEAANLYRDLAFPEVEGRPFVAANMVASADGRAIVDGGAKLLGGPLDRALMRRVRAAVDCVLVGAATLRAEGYDASVGPEEAAARLARGEPPQPLAAVVTSSGNLPRRRGFFHVDGQRALVLTTTTAAVAHRDAFSSLEGLAEVVPIPSQGEWLGARGILDALHRRFAVRRLLVEGGPRLVGELLAEGLVDQIFLTVSPLAVGGLQRTIADVAAPFSPPARLALVSVASDGDFVFLRYEVLR